jgi:hypothetical protein
VGVCQISGLRGTPPTGRAPTLRRPSTRRACSSHACTRRDNRSLLVSSCQKLSQGVRARCNANPNHSWVSTPMDYTYEHACLLATAAASQTGVRSGTTPRPPVYLGISSNGLVKRFKITTPQFLCKRRGKTRSTTSLNHLPYCPAIPILSSRYAPAAAATRLHNLISCACLAWKIFF